MLIAFKPLQSLKFKSTKLKDKTMDVPSLLGIENYDFRLVFGKTKIEYDKEKENINRNNHHFS